MFSISDTLVFDTATQVSFANPIIVIGLYELVQLNTTVSFLLISWYATRCRPAKDIIRRRIAHEMKNQEDVRRTVVKAYAKAVSAPVAESCCAAPVQKGEVVKVAGYSREDRTPQETDGLSARPRSR